MRFVIAGILFWCNTQWAGIAVLNPYRRWWVEYSYGQTMNRDGQWVNLWHFPTLGHLDMRKVMLHIHAVVEKGE
jgi:hypothetical protein